MNSFSYGDDSLEEEFDDFDEFEDEDLEEELLDDELDDEEDELDTEKYLEKKLKILTIMKMIMTEIGKAGRHLVRLEPDSERILSFRSNRKTS